MREETKQKVCERCGRRFAQPRIVKYGRCTLCDGKLVPLYEALGVGENGNR
jgi:DNA-directed RNA polymerase subunit RPC12/RpoP